MEEMSSYNNSAALKGIRSDQAHCRQREMRSKTWGVFLFVYHSTFRYLKGFEHPQRLRTFPGDRDQLVSQI